MGITNKDDETTARSFGLSSNLNMKVIIVLLVLGLTALLSDLIFGIKNKPSLNK